MRKLVTLDGSPYVRKVRIVLAEKGLDYEAVPLKQYPPTAEAVAPNPVLTVPVFTDGDLELFESNLIVDYLLQTYPGNAAEAAPPLVASLTRPEHHWRDAQLLSVLDALTHSLIRPFYIRWTGLEPVGPNALGLTLAERHKAKVRSCLDWLEARATPEGFLPGVFSIQDIALCCALAWSDARTQAPWRGRPNLEAIVAGVAQRPSFRQVPVSPWSPRV